MRECVVRTVKFEILNRANLSLWAELKFLDFLMVIPQQHTVESRN